VHDYLVQYGGAERVLERLLEIYPQAPIYTLLYNPKALAPALRRKLSKRKIITSSLQKFPGAKKHHRFYPLLMPYMIEQFDLRNYDIVISDTTSFAKGLILSPQTLHICYCHTPLRYAWDNSQGYIRSYKHFSLLKPFVKWGVHYIRIWDRQAAQRVDYYLTNSYFVKKRIKKYYHHDAKVVYPPIATKNFKSSLKIKNYYLLVNRLLPYKRTDIAIKAFNKLKLPLVIVGEGPSKRMLKKMAYGNIKFLGNIYGKNLKKLYQQCQALIFPQEEDFGIAPVEVMASGRPIIAHKKGGALETVKENVNGIFFSQQTAESLIEAIKKFQTTRFSCQKIIKSVQKFDESNFKKQIETFVKKNWEKYKNDFEKNL